MAGCFGNHPVDRWMEDQLIAHLNSECYADDCKYAGDEDECIDDCDKCCHGDNYEPEPDVDCDYYMGENVI